MDRSKTHYEDDHLMFGEALKSFLAKEVVPHQEKWAEDGIVPREIWQKAGEQGFLLPWADEKYGGAGAKDFRFEQIITEELANINETGLMIPLHSATCAPYLNTFGTDEQKQRYMPKCVSGETILAIAMTEPDAGSDLNSMRSHAKDCGDHFLLNGSKVFISNGINADLVIVAAKTSSEKRHTIGLFLVETGMDGFERGKKLKKIGLHSQDTAELFFTDVKVPKENILGHPEKGFYQMMEMLAHERLSVACTGVSGAQAALKWTVDYVRERKAFGKPIAAFQNTRFKLAELKTQIDATQAYIDQCVHALNANQLTAEEAAQAKLLATETQGKVVDECLQLFGGNGYMMEYPISRAYVDARVQRIYAGTSEIMKEIISRSMNLT